MKFTLKDTIAKQTAEREAAPAITEKPQLKLGSDQPKVTQPDTSVDLTVPESKPTSNGIKLGKPTPESKPFESANKMEVPALSANESPATAPARELPESMNAQQQEFLANLDQLYRPEVFGDIPLVQQCIRGLVVEMRENPNYVELVHDDDRHMMIKALIETLGLAKVTKAAKKRKVKKSVAPKSTKALANLGAEGEGILDDLFAGVKGLS